MEIPRFFRSALFPLILIVMVVAVVTITFFPAKEEDSTRDVVHTSGSNVEIYETEGASGVPCVIAYLENGNSLAMDCDWEERR